MLAQFIRFLRRWRYKLYQLRACHKCQHYYVDVGFEWCLHPESDTKLGLHTTYQARYPDGYCRPRGRFFTKKSEQA